MAFKKCAVALFIFITALLVTAPIAVNAQQQAQKTPQAAPSFEAKLQALDAATLMNNQTPVKLWGVKAIEGMSVPFQLAARNMLDKAIANENVRCEIKSRDQTSITAQCTNAAQQDLGLYMLQKGYVIADRSSLWGSVFENAYLNAEKEAQIEELGVWSDSSFAGLASKSGNFVMILGAVLLLGVLAVFATLTMTIMRGFQSVSDAQKENVEMMVRERELRNKERKIFAGMLDSEIKANKSKIEAYLVVYDEMLKDLRNTERPPKYKTAGDIVQLQPSMDRSVFDRNTDKLDILGNRLASQVIHFYARIKSKPDYQNIEPDTPLKEAIDLVEKAYDNAQRMNQLSDRLIDFFAQGGYSEDNIVT